MPCTWDRSRFADGSNETQDERRRTRARVARSESVEVISKVERTAVRRSLHRMVRSLWVYWRPWRNDLSAAPSQVLRHHRHRTYPLVQVGIRIFVRHVSKRNCALPHARKLVAPLSWSRIGPRPH